MSTTKAKQLKKVQELTGAEAREINVYQIQLSTLLENGILIDVDTNGLSRFYSRLTWAELGIDEIDKRYRNIRKGSKCLLRPDNLVKKLQSIGTRAAQQITPRYSYEIAGFRGYRLVMATAYEQWRNEFDEQVERWNETVEEIIENLDDYMDQLAIDELEIAADVWAQWKALARKRGYGRNSKMITPEGTFATEDEFSTWMVERALSLVPTADAIRTDVRLEYRLAMLASKEGIQAEHAQFRLEHEQSVAAEKIAQAKAETAETEEWAKREAMRAQADAMHAAEMEHARQLIIDNGSPYADIINSLRSQIAQEVTDILEKYKKHGHFKGRSSQRAKGLRAFFDLMAAHDDQELRAKLVELESLVTQVTNKTNGKETDGAAVRSALEQLKEITHQEVDAISAPSRFSMLEF